jgi:hypothetical protein
MSKNLKPIPIDPEDGLPDVPAMVDGGYSITEALKIWVEANPSPQQEHPEPFQEPQQSASSTR